MELGMKWDENCDNNCLECPGWGECLSDVEFLEELSEDKQPGLKTGPVDKHLYDSIFQTRRWTDQRCGICGAQAQEWEGEQGGVGLVCSNTNCTAFYDNGRWKHQ